MSEHRYPARALAGDYGRAALGLALTGVPLVFLDVGLWTTVVLGTLAALFAVFAADTALRQFSVLAVDETGIAVAGPLARRIEWVRLERLRLRYYAVRRGRESWMQLRLNAPRCRIAVDSRISGFSAIAGAAAQAVERRGVRLDAATAANLGALGYGTRR